MPSNVRPVQRRAPSDAEAFDADDRFEQMRRQILDAARMCFERFGVSRTRVEDVATAAGISRPLLYQFFDGRRALIDAMIIDELSRLFAQLQSQVPDKGFEDTLVELSVASTTLGRSDTLLDDLFDNSRYNDVASLMEERSSPAYQMMVDLWAPIFERGRQEGVLRNDVDDVELVDWLMMVHHIFHQRRDVPLERVGDMLRRFVLASFTNNAKPTATPADNKHITLTAP